MSKNNENKLVPRLRFPEFTNENWNRKTIDETCEILNNLRKPLTTNLREKGIYPYYGASGIIDYVKDYIFNERLLLIGEDGAKWLAYEKTAFIAEGKYWVNNHAHVLKPIGVVDTLLENYLVKLDISPFITGAAPPKLTLGKLKSIPVPIPENQKEQQKIAACLSSLDDVITAESKKLEVLKEHKKGLLQNLFPQEGETVPKLRFKEFEDSGEWVERTLGEVSDNVMYGMNSAAIMFDGENKYIRITDIDDNTRLFSPNPLTSPDGQLDDKYFVNVGDILFARTGASVGKSYLHQKENGKIYFAGFLIRFTIKNANPYFIYLQTLTEKYQKWVSKTSLRSGQPGINAEEFKSYPILISSLPEQQRIASCLSSLDNLINAQSQKIETLKLHKKGLLQGLFPDINEHNG
jgi:type I restriction enzyme S subunit